MNVSIFIFSIFCDICKISKMEMQSNVFQIRS